MSMDDQHREMERFFKDLQSFNGHLRISVSNLSQHHSAVDPLWQDEFRKEYDRIWQEFEDGMASYINREAPEYEEFLFQQLKWLRRYLYGR